MLKDFWNREPALILGLVGATIALVTAFGLSLTTQQIGAIMAFVTALIAFITRSQVAPTSGATAPPSIDMSKRAGTLVLALAIGLGAAAATTSGCGPIKANLTAPASLSEDGKAAFYKTRVIKAVDLVRDTAIDANTTLGPDGAAVMSTAGTRTVVTWHRSALITMKASDAGWKAGLEAGVDELLADVPAHDKTLIAPYAALLKTILQEIN